MIVLLLKLLLAHILGDFVFQPSSWVKNKKKNKYRSPKLYWHISIHSIALLFALKFDFSYWLGILLIVGSHFIIDLGKLYADGIIKDRWLFFIDQILHLLVILGVVYMYKPFQLPIDEVYTASNLLLAVFLLTVTYVTSITMRILISRWKPEESKKDALKNAGSYIGMLERLFVFGFIIINYWEGIGFLLAAKSVFRFGDLSNAKDRNLTEYILIGTLLSFGLAILLAMIYQHLSQVRLNY